MTDRPATDADGRMDPMVPEMPTTRVQTDGGRIRTDESAAETVAHEAGAPLVPDLS